jgi:hypothetical protein
MESLTTSDQLLYFTNNELNSTIGLSITKKKPTMWFQERDELLTQTKSFNNFKGFKESTLGQYEDVEKAIFKVSELSSPCMCSGITAEHLAVITANNDPSHKATYKLHLYRMTKVGVYSYKYNDSGIYYSYFA